MTKDQTRSKVSVFLVARTNSSRLPHKVLLDVKGKPLIVHQIERMRLARLPDLIVLCTTKSPVDDKLATLGHDTGIKVFRGNELDVPRRLLDAAEQFDVSFFVVAEGDEVFVDATYIDAVIKRAQETGADYVKVKGIPIGSWVFGISRNALLMLCEEVHTESLDGWGSFFENNTRFRTEIVSADPETAALSETLRLTIDYPEDFQLLEAIYDQLYEPGRVFTLHEVLQLLHKKPQLAEINRYLIDIYWQRLQQRKGET